MTIASEQAEAASQRAAALQVFSQIATDMSELRKDVKDVRERMIRIEAQDFVEKVRVLDNKVDQLQSELLVLKTKSAPIFFGINAVITAIISSGILIIFRAFFT